jgi:hypothetical protein
VKNQTTTVFEILRSWVNDAVNYMNALAAI